MRTTWQAVLDGTLAARATKMLDELIVTLGDDSAGGGAVLQQGAGCALLRGYVAAHGRRAATMRSVYRRSNKLSSNSRWKS